MALNVKRYEAIAGSYLKFKTWRSKKSESGNTSFLTRLSNSFTWLKDAKPSPWIPRLLMPFRGLVIRTFVEARYNEEILYGLRAQNEPLLIVANHFGLRDHPALVSVLGKPTRIVAKRQQFESYFANWFWRAFAAIPITRGKPQISEVKDLYLCWENGEWVLMYPHGTLTFAHPDVSPDFLTAPIQSGTARFAYKKNIKILVVAMGLGSPGIFGYKYQILFDTVLDPRDFGSEQELHQAVQQHLDEATMRLHGFTSPDPSHC
jgi:1-acyl-sn-glycerol-3-phosphate acyltransferase